MGGYAGRHIEDCGQKAIKTIVEKSRGRFLSEGSHNRPRHGRSAAEIPVGFSIRASTPATYAVLRRLCTLSGVPRPSSLERQQGSGKSLRPNLNHLLLWYAFASTTVAVRIRLQPSTISRF